jgi:hypothetical protein
MHRWTTLILSTFVVFALVGMVTVSGEAQQPPPLPHAFYGRVEINGQPAPVGTVVEARGQGVLVGVPGNPISISQAGRYGGPGAFDQKLVVQGDIAEGTQIAFFVNGIRAQCALPGGGWQDSVPFHSGGITELNLRIVQEGTPPPTPSVTPTKTAISKTPTMTPTNVGTPSPTTPEGTVIASSTPTLVETATIVPQLTPSPMKPVNTPVGIKTPVVTMPISSPQPSVLATAMQTIPPTAGSDATMRGTPGATPEATIVAERASPTEAPVMMAATNVPPAQSGFGNSAGLLTGWILVLIGLGVLGAIGFAVSRQRKKV